MEIGIRRRGVRRLRMRGDFLHQVVDCAFDLYVMPLALGLQVVVEVDVGSDAVVLDLPLAAQARQRQARHGDEAAVDEQRISMHLAHSHCKKYS